MHKVLAVGLFNRFLCLQAQKDDYLWRYLDLDLKTFDHHRLCRIKVDITNDLDHEWRVDVKKETASPPMRYRNDLLRIAKNTRERSGKVQG